MQVRGPRAGGNGKYRIRRRAGHDEVEVNIERRYVCAVHWLAALCVGGRPVGRPVPEFARPQSSKVEDDGGVFGCGTGVRRATRLLVPLCALGRTGLGHRRVLGLGVGALVRAGHSRKVARCCRKIGETITFGS